MPLLSKFQSVGASTTVNTDYTPANGEKVYVKKLSAQAPANGTAFGQLIWDPAGVNQIIDAWTADKVMEFDSNSNDFVFTGDGSKILRLSIQNTAALSAARIGGSVIYEIG